MAAIQAQAQTAPDFRTEISMIRVGVNPFLSDLEKKPSTEEPATGELRQERRQPMSSSASRHWSNRGIESSQAAGEAGNLHFGGPGSYRSYRGPPRSISMELILNLGIPRTALPPSQTDPKDSRSRRLRFKRRAKPGQKSTSSRPWNSIAESLSSSARNGWGRNCRRKRRWFFFSRHSKNNIRGIWKTTTHRRRSTQADRHCRACCILDETSSQKTFP